MIGTEPTNTHGYRLKRSQKHRNELITRVPVGYLKWMVNVGHQEAPYAEAELKRRGTVTPEFDISGHAIDSASLRLFKLWDTQRRKDEGLHAWLCRMTAGALKNGEMINESITYRGIRYVFAADGVWPVLKTVMRRKSKSSNNSPSPAHAEASES